MNKNDLVKNLITERAVYLLFLMLSVLQLSAIAGSGKEKHTGKIVAYAAPKGETLSSDYLVKVNGQPIDIYLAKTQHT